MIYLVEDDENIRELVTYTLNNSNLETEGFGLPSQFWAALEQGGKPSLIMLDIMLPEEDGFSILKKLRASPATKKIPIMMVTAKGSEYDKVIGLDNGADDYIAKPFGMMELIARVGDRDRVHHRLSVCLSCQAHCAGGRQRCDPDLQGV